MVTVSPTVRQRELGIRLRELRNAKGLTVEDVAGQLLCSATKISRAETGARRPSLRDVRDLCGIYDVDEETSAELMELARQAREPGWWTEYDDLKNCDRSSAWSRKPHRSPASACTSCLPCFRARTTPGK